MMKNESNKVDSTLLRKFFHRECNIKEQKLVTEYLADLENDRELRYIFRDNWNQIKMDPSEFDLETTHILDKVHHRIHMDSYKRSRERSFFSSMYHHFSKIAAIILFPVLLFSGWLFLSNGLFISKKDIGYAKVISPPTSRTQLSLPDGTICWLNSGSSIRYPTRFTGAQREVELSGEGYFDIARNALKPFIVKAASLEIKALGTSFNVSAYADDENCVVTLESGKVAIGKILHDSKPIKIADLQPNQQIVLSKQCKLVTLDRVDTKKYTSWIEGKLVLRNDPMNEVIKRIGRWYNVDIILGDKELEDYRYHATFKDETISEILEMLKLTSPIDYIEHERKKLQNGTYTKKRVTLFLKK